VQASLGATHHLGFSRGAGYQDPLSHPRRSASRAQSRPGRRAMRPHGGRLSAAQRSPADWLWGFLAQHRRVPRLLGFAPIASRCASYSKSRRVSPSAPPGLAL